MTILKAQKLRDDIVSTLEDRNFGALRSIARRAMTMPISQSALLSTGLGLLMKDRSLWALAPQVEWEHLCELDKITAWGRSGGAWRQHSVDLTGGLAHPGGRHRRRRLAP